YINNIDNITYKKYIKTLNIIYDDLRERAAEQIINLPERKNSQDILKHIKEQKSIIFPEDNNTPASNITPITIQLKGNVSHTSHDTHKREEGDKTPIRIVKPTDTNPKN
ncbi:MAG: hypothetical protein ACRCUM_01715, partial [Mycoplasmoidaceae bacterium]